MGRFVIYTFVGSYIWGWCWCWGWCLAWVGLTLGQNWNTLGVYFHRFDAAIGVVLLIGVIWFVRRHLNHMKRP